MAETSPDPTSLKSLFIDIVSTIINSDNFKDGVQNVQNNISSVLTPEQISSIEELSNIEKLILLEEVYRIVRRNPTFQRGSGYKIAYILKKCIRILTGSSLIYTANLLNNNKDNLTLNSRFPVQFLALVNLIVGSDIIVNQVTTTIVNGVRNIRNIAIQYDVNQGAILEENLPENLPENIP